MVFAKLEQLLYAPLAKWKTIIAETVPASKQPMFKQEFGNQIKAYEHEIHRLFRPLFSKLRHLDAYQDALLEAMALIAALDPKTLPGENCDPAQHLEAVLDGGEII
jgi:hypothetical protein